MTSLLFYTTVGCHLCEEAELLLGELANELTAENNFDLETVDIASSEDLVELYGIRIPVVRNATTKDEIGWPFDKAALLGLLR